MTGLSGRPAWDVSLGGAVYGEPLIYGGRVYVATEDDTVDALSAATGQLLWSLRVGTPVPLSSIRSTPTVSSYCGDIDPLGVTGTPVIDPATGELYVVAESETGRSTSWQGVRHVMVAVSLGRHRVAWRRLIDPPGGNRPGSYYIPAEQQRTALTLLDGRIYAGFGGLYGDCGQYHGYVVDLSATGGGAVGVYQVPSQREGAIWETNGILVSTAGDLYVATGNGSSRSLADFDEGNSVVELSASLHRLAVWAPSDWVELNDEDWDLGSAGPIQVSGTSLLFVAGKPTTSSVGYLMAEGRLDGIGRGAFSGPVCTSGGVFGADASDALGGADLRRMVYVPCGGGTVALEVTTSPMRFHRVWVASAGSPDGPPIVAGGLVWAVNWATGHLYAMRPATGQVVFQRFTGPLAHFATPGVGDAMVVVPTLGGVEAFRASG